MILIDDLDFAKNLWICAILIIQHIFSGCQQRYLLELAATVFVPSSVAPLITKLYGKLVKIRNQTDTGQLHVLATAFAGDILYLPNTALDANINDWCGKVKRLSIVTARKAIVSGQFRQWVKLCGNFPTSGFGISVGFSEHQGATVEISYAIYAVRELFKKLIHKHIVELSEL